MTKIKQPLGAWTPDQPDYDLPGLIAATNVYPRTATSYGPIPSLVPSSVSALPSQVLGLYAFRAADDTVRLFAGTATDLYELNSGDTSWNNVSKSTGVYTGDANHPWIFIPFGKTVIATNFNDPIQNFLVGTDTQFSDLAAAAPRAYYMCVIKDFLLVANTHDSTNGALPQRVWWPAVGDPSTWPVLGSNTAAELLSDAQDLRSDLGWCTGVVSNLNSSSGAVFMEQGVYSVNFQGGTVIFSFDIIQGAVGCPYPRSIVVNQGFAYWLGTDGFYSTEGTVPTPLSAQQISNWFFTDVNDGADPAYLSLIQGAASPQGNLILWIYCGPSSGGKPNRMLIYNWMLQRWSIARITMNWLSRGLSF